MSCRSTGEDGVGPLGILPYMDERPEAGQRVYSPRVLAIYDAFVPRLAKRMAELAAELEAQDAVAPRVLSIVPADGATDVEPGNVELRVEFDRPMRDGSWSVCRTDRPFPEASAPRYDDARRVFTLEMALEPGRTYGLSLNCLGNLAFVSEDGVPLEPVEVVFTTRAP